MEATCLPVRRLGSHTEAAQCRLRACVCLRSCVCPRVCEAVGEGLLCGQGLAQVKSRGTTAHHGLNPIVVRER